MFKDFPVVVLSLFIFIYCSRDLSRRRSEESYPVCLNEIFPFEFWWEEKRFCFLEWVSHDRSHSSNITPKYYGDGDLPSCQWCFINGHPNTSLLTIYNTIKDDVYKFKLRKNSNQSSLKNLLWKFESTGVADEFLNRPIMNFDQLLAASEKILSYLRYFIYM